MVENIEKFGHSDVIVTNNYAADYKKTGLAFDLIVADVPCSGEGMFRKDDGAINQWSSQYVEKCQQLQREIVSDIWHNLKEDGILIYSTCTFNALENEENVEWIIDELGAECIDIEIDSSWNITPALSNKVKGYRFLPGISKGEGLFMCALRKTSEHHARANKTKKSKQNNINTKPLRQLVANQSSYLHRKKRKDNGSSTALSPCLRTGCQSIAYSSCRNNDGNAKRKESYSPPFSRFFNSNQSTSVLQ